LQKAVAGFAQRIGRIDGLSGMTRFARLVWREIGDHFPVDGFHFGVRVGLVAGQAEGDAVGGEGIGRGDGVPAGVTIGAGGETGIGGSGDVSGIVVFDGGMAIAAVAGYVGGKITPRLSRVGAVRVLVPRPVLVAIGAVDGLFGLRAVNRLRQRIGADAHRQRFAGGEGDLPIVSEVTSATGVIGRWAIGEGDRQEKYPQRQTGHPTGCNTSE